MALEDPILLVGDQPAQCPKCGRRLNEGDEIIDRDINGSIRAGECPQHGLFRIQDDHPGSGDAQ